VSAFEGLGEIAPVALRDGVLARIVSGTQCSLAIVELDPGSVVEEHSHANEQLGVVIRGSVTFRIDQNVQELGPGDTWLVPPHAPHEVRAGAQGAVVADIFSPPRDDWAALDREKPRAPRWP
jgi:quercetin dioxygenase-like cupin family protein